MHSDALMRLAFESEDSSRDVGVLYITGKYIIDYVYSYRRLENLILI